MFRNGDDRDEIVTSDWTPTLAEVYAALAYYYEHRDEIDADISDGRRLVEELTQGPRGQSSRNSGAASG